MSTALFDKVIFGPVKSRRLGVSLGVNLLLPSAKLCNFDCIYCECGWNRDSPGGAFNKKEEVLEILSQTIEKMVTDGTPPDYITFAGNGEPTMHPDFEEIIEGTLAVRDRLASGAKVAVLTNSTMLYRESVRRALKRVDKAMLKLDSAFDATMQVMNQPLGRRSVEDTVALMESLEGDFVIQTMFLRGEYNGVSFDNTSKEEVAAWLEIIARLRPREVMLYSIDRDTPHSDLVKITREELLEIAREVEGLGISVSVS